MSQQYVEKNLLFDFDDDWTLLRWDRHPFHQDTMSRAHLGKGVDFVGARDGVLFFIEVKDFSVHSRNTEKMPLPDEVELKIRSTVAALVGAHRTGEHPDVTAMFELLRTRSRLRLVLWLEEPRADHLASAVLRKRRQVRRLHERERVMIEVRWLGARTAITSLFEDHDSVLPKVSVRRLPAERREKAEQVVSILTQRGMPVLDKARWQIEDTLDMAVLDEWLEKARSVGSVHQLFQSR